MCACEPGYVCSRCADTPQDWRVEGEAEQERDGSYSRPGAADVFDIRYFFVYE